MPFKYVYTSYWLIIQGQTIQMMYEIIAQEIKNSNLENSHPQDYLNFYCLGNRERCKDDEGKNPLDGSSVSTQISILSCICNWVEYNSSISYFHEI